MTIKEFAEEINCNQAFGFFVGASMFGLFIAFGLLLITWSIPDTNCSKEAFLSLRSDVNVLREKMQLIESLRGEK